MKNLHDIQKHSRARDETPPSYQQICEIIIIIIIKAHTKGEFSQEKSFIIKQMNNK